MRPAFRLLAAAATKPVYGPASAAAAASPNRPIEPNLPTGLTGLKTHASPRSTLLYLYARTLANVSNAPETSLYRQSVESTTKHRMEVVESVVPPGYAEWSAKRAAEIKRQVSTANADEEGVVMINGARARLVKVGGKSFVFEKTVPKVDKYGTNLEWDGERERTATADMPMPPPAFGGKGAEALKKAMGGVKIKPGETPAREDIGAAFDKAKKDTGWEEPKASPGIVGLEPEPQLTREQVGEIEDKIGSGLIEELIQVAEGELKLVEYMVQARPWEDLEEKPAEGQWTYFDRQT